MRCATIDLFGRRGGIGREPLAEFFRRLRRDRPIGVSPRSLHRLTVRIEGLILDATETYAQGNGGCAHVMVGADETFFEQVILVMIDLGSG